MNTKFTVECEMEERWINQFMSFLNHLQKNGEQGHSEIVGFYSDGDGDFRPKFICNRCHTIQPPYGAIGRDIKNIYDAG